MWARTPAWAELRMGAEAPRPDRDVAWAPGARPGLQGDETAGGQAPQRRVGGPGVGRRQRAAVAQPLEDRALAGRQPRSRGRPGGQGRTGGRGYSGGRGRACGVTAAQGSDPGGGELGNQRGAGARARGEARGQDQGQRAGRRGAVLARDPVGERDQLGRDPQLECSQRGGQSLGLDRGLIGQPHDHAEEPLASERDLEQAADLDARPQALGDQIVEGPTHRARGRERLDPGDGGHSLTLGPGSDPIAVHPARPAVALRMEGPSRLSSLPIADQRVGPPAGVGGDSTVHRSNLERRMGLRAGSVT